MKRINRKQIATIIAALVAVCCCLPICVTAIWQQTPAGKADMTKQAIVKLSETPVPSKTPVSSNTPKPTATDKASETPQPTIAEDLPPTASATLILPTDTPQPDEHDTPAPTTPPDKSTSAPGQPTAVTSGIGAVVASNTARISGFMTVSVVTVPGSACNLVYHLPSGATSTASGLGPKTADSHGNCSWTWKIAANTKPGMGSLVLTAGGETRTLPLELK